MISGMIEDLRMSEEPAVRLKTLRDVLCHSMDSPEMAQEEARVRASKRVQALLSEVGADGRLPYHAYQKWSGAHWLLVTLADLGYPRGDERLIPLREQVLEWLLPNTGSLSPWRKKLLVDGRVRTCASQEGNALYALLALGLADERTERLVEGLLAWQWPDGGWNCDKRAPVWRASFHETITPLRGLVWYARVTGSSAARAAAERAAEVFLRRGLFRRQSDGEIIHPSLVELHWPHYWHYDLLFGLEVMAAGGWIGDERCREALDWLETKRLPDGGFAAEKGYYRVVKDPAQPRKSQASLVDWGGASQVKMNEWVTVAALTALRAGGRLQIESIEPR